MIHTWTKPTIIEVTGQDWAMLASHGSLHVRKWGAEGLIRFQNHGIPFAELGAVARTLWDRLMRGRGINVVVTLAKSTMIFSAIIARTRFFEPEGEFCNGMPVLPVMDGSHHETYQMAMWTDIEATGPIVEVWNPSRINTPR
jgi:hypothetical protein